MPYIEAEYAKRKDMDHFSIFLLKDKIGTKIQQVLEKNGDTPMQISSVAAVQVVNTLPLLPTGMGVVQLIELMNEKSYAHIVIWCFMFL